VVTVEEKDTHLFRKYGPLAGIYFQQSIEQKAFDAGGGRFVAPAQRMVDFSRNKLSATVPASSYLPGLHPVDLNEVLPTLFTRLNRLLMSLERK
jgi:uncharacterized FAD-dependent dehydrogenase